MSTPDRRLVSVAFALALTFASLPREARALNVVHDGVTYDLEIYNGSYDSDPSAFALPADGGRMGWWGNPTLASALAEQLLGALSPTPYPPAGPLFATAFQAEEVNGEVIANFFDLSTLGSTNLIDEAGFARGSSQTYVVEAMPVPAPVPLVATALFLRATGRLRHLSARLWRLRSHL